MHGAVNPSINQKRFLSNKFLLMPLSCLMGKLFASTIDLSHTTSIMKVLFKNDGVSFCRTMSRVFLVIFVLFVLTLTQAIAEELALSNAGAIYSSSLVKSSKLANKALPLIAEINNVDTQVAKLGTTPQSYLSEKDFLLYRKKQAELHQLFALQNTESALTNDLLVLNKLYEAALLYHSVQAEFVRRRGTGNGFAAWLKTQDTVDKKMRSALDLLVKVRLQVKKTPIQ